MIETESESQHGASPASALRHRFETVRSATLAFTAPLSPEDMMVQSSADASPVKWHLAHTSWFFETFVLAPFARGYKPFHPDFNWLFNSYYTSLGDMPAKNLRSSFSRPPLDAIRDYRTYVDRAIVALLSSELAESEDDVLRRIALGLEHEQQHLELIATDIKHAFFTNPLHPALVSGSPREPDFAAFEPTAYTAFKGGLVEVGITPDASDPMAFAFDNETPRHQVFLQPFALANRLVTAREYLAFIDDNGYTRPELWLSEGWATMRREGWQAPLYWQSTPLTASMWRVFTMHGYQPLEDLLDRPVCHLSLFEADAYARWAGQRLPTEFEWEHAAATAAAVLERPNMLESGALHPVPARQTTHLEQMFGDVWEWTASGYTGYPGYRPLPGALGEYNGKFMSSQIILRGGSCVTPQTHIRPTYRNFFPPSTRWQFSGLRLAKGA